MVKKIELLAPAGDFASLQAAVNAGADAIYFGLQEFNMRDSAKNFKLSDLLKIEKICGKKVKKYLTLNTIVYETELSKIERTIKGVKGKVDAIICWDPSVIQLCKKYKIPFHISTQASVANKSSAIFYKNLGAERIVAARELSLGQLKEIAKVIDVECFIHGAMCVAESGRCFTSQFLFGKSANRGQCLHPCRRPYTVVDEEGNNLILENSRVMSAKDLCTLPFIEKLKKLGVVAFKIEGRNRSAEYVGMVVRVYRKALDTKMTRSAINTGLEELKKVYHRGFSNGFYLGEPGAEDFSNSETGDAKESKKKIGIVLKYWPKAEAAAVKIFSDGLKAGEEVYIIGKGAGALRVRVDSLEIENKKIDEAKKGQLVGIKLPFCKKGDEVYLIVEKKTNQK